GALTINNTGSARIYLTSPSAGTPNTINIKGNLILQAGQFSSNGSGSSAVITVNSYGNIIVTGGNFSISRGSGPVVTWNSYGDSLSLSNATTQTSGSNDIFVFAKRGMQYLNFNKVTFGSGSLPAAVDTGATLVMGTNAWGGDAIFAVDSGATLMSGDTTGLDGNIATTGTVALSSGASYAFNGAVAQTTGLHLPATVKNLTINNPNGVTLSRSVAATGTLTLTSGSLMLDTNTVTASSAISTSMTSYVSTDSAKSYLKIPNVGSTKVVFPVGTTAEGYSPVWITNAGTADAYTVNASKDTAVVGGGGRVNVDWNIGEGTAGGSNLALQFGWMASAENSVFSKDPATNAAIYLFSSTDTSQAGTGSYTTQLSYEPYTVSRAGITSVGKFAVGNFSTTGVNSPENVPVVFKLFQNYPNPFNPTTKIEFSVARKGMASVEVYNILGQHVVTLFSGEAQPGLKYSVNFNGASYASGVYFSVLQSDGQRQIQKMVLMK
ncbi:MAG: T9SS type A sorting domain-containing protein, partial [Bacteroidetes bacterium]|nr:T9SS type A sorting domain-containing protein [Bacteroidota bacterium]